MSAIERFHCIVFINIINSVLDLVYEKYLHFCISTEVHITPLHRSTHHFCSSLCLQEKEKSSFHKLYPKHEFLPKPIIKIYIQKVKSKHLKTVKCRKNCKRERVAQTFHLSFSLLSKM